MRAAGWVFATATSVTAVILTARRGARALPVDQGTYLIDQAPDPIIRVDPAGRIRAFNRAAETLSGFTAEAVVGRHFATVGILSPLSLARALRNFAQAIVGLAPPPEELEIRTRGGETRYVEGNIQVFRSRGVPTEVQVIFRDVTERRRTAAVLATTKREVEQERDKFRALAESLASGLFLVDASGTISFCNARIAEVAGIAAEELVGSPVADLRQLILTQAQDPGAAERALAEILTARPVHASCVIEMARPEQRVFEFSSFPVPALGARQAQPGQGGLVRDVTVERALEEQLRYQAQHDVLTGLANRALFTDRLEHAAQQARAPDHAVAVLLLDLDRFKEVNDRLGHGTGDELLVQVARRLEAALSKARPDRATIARLGGDEFVILVEQARLAQEVTDLADVILEQLRFSFNVPRVSPVISTSIGIAFLGPGASPREVLTQADVALYQAKERGGNRWVVFQDDLAMPA